MSTLIEPVRAGVRNGPRPERHREPVRITTGSVPAGLLPCTASWPAIDQGVQTHTAAYA